MPISHFAKAGATMRAQGDIKPPNMSIFGDTEAIIQAIKGKIR